MNIRTLLIAGVALPLTILGCASGNSDVPVGKEIVIEKTSFSFDMEKAPFELFQAYSIKAGDLLDVLLQFTTWTERTHFLIAVDHTIDVRFIRVPEMNVTQKVLPDGTISLPYLGNVKVTGKTVDELVAELKKQYSTTFKNPDISVLVPEFQNAITELKRDLYTSPRGLSRLATVRPDGYITFPLVGDFLVAGKTIPEVSALLNKRYDGILPGMHCDLFLEKHAGSVIYVMGEVKTPGAYPIANPISAFQGLTLAGGHSSTALLEEVLVVRKHEQKLVATRVDLRQNLDLKSGTAFFFLMPDDIVIVPKTKLASAAEVARSIGDIIFYRGWGGINFGYDLRKSSGGTP
ncbi:MAG: polysaccharide biosynthesis/export family protein [Candidatus Methylomirabilia bacterium]